VGATFENSVPLDEKHHQKTVWTVVLKLLVKGGLGTQNDREAQGDTRSGYLNNDKE
jgi:hypothetical protein